jgi:hypothetical protein
MKRSKFPEEQIAYALRQAESGTPVGGLPAVGGQRRDVLCVEEEVRPPGGDGSAPDTPVAAGSWGGQRPSMGVYVTGTGATRGATAAGGR